MKIHRKLTAAILAILVLISTIFCASAAQKEIALLSAKTGLIPLGSDAGFSATLPVTYADLPSSFSSAAEGHVLPVRQQNANTCWAFGTLSSFETLLLCNGEENIKAFAPQHANFWGSKRADGTGWQRDINNGGYSYIPLGYLTSWYGPVNEEDFPESTKSKDVYNDSLKTLTPQYGLTAAVFFNSDSPRDSIKSLIYNYGSVVGNFNADTQYMTDYTNFYCGDHTIASNQLQGHCVSIVGWDDNYPKENFTAKGTPENDGAWLIKNSWSRYINDIGGYFWISYEDAWIFDSIFGPSYALTDYTEINDQTKLYQNEQDGATYEFSYLTGQSSNPYAEITYMNVFDFTEEDRNLDKVVFESTSYGADYTVYYIPLDGDKPSGNKEDWTELYCDIIDHTGYICADFEDIILPAGKGAIGICIDNEITYKLNHKKEGYTYIPNSIGVSEWLNSGSRMLFVPEADYGMCYFMDTSWDSKVKDVMSFYKQYLDDEVGGTFVIKAITQNEVPDDIPTSATSTSAVTTATLPSETTTDKPAPVTSAPVVTDPTTAPIPTETTTSPLVTEPSSSITTDPTETTAPLTSIPVTSIPVTSIPVTSIPVFTSAPASSATSPSTSTTNPDVVQMYYIGDADLNNKINVKDATLIQKHAAEITRMEGLQLVSADINGKGGVNVQDATLIQKFIAGISNQYKIGDPVYLFS